MSRLEVHGNILETLLRQDSYSFLSPWVSLLLLMIVATTSWHLFRQVPSDYVLTAGLFCLAAIGLLAWISLWGLSMQIPLTSMGLVCGLNLICILQSRFNTLSQFFADWKLLRRVNMKITCQQSYDEIWNSVANSAMQIFHPERLALLEKETAATHLRLREVLGCDKSEITEKRRDISRSPYRDVFEQRRPIDIEFRPFFVTDESDTVQLMVPLVSGPDPQGLMVLEMRRESVDDWSDLDERLAEFADEMSAFVAGIRERELERLLSKSIIRRSRFVPERIDTRVLYQDEVEHRDYEELLDNAIEGLQIPVAIYDVFGSLLKSNAEMTDLLQEQDVSVKDSGCADVIATLTGRDIEKCRALVRRCLIDERSEEIVLSPTDTQQSARILYVTPLNSGDPAVDASIEHRSLSIQLVDSRIFQEINQWHQGFVQSQASVLRSQLSRLQQFVDKNLTPGQQTEIDQYQELANEIAGALDQCQEAFSSGVGDEPKDHFAAEIDPILAKAVEISAAESEARGVKIVNESVGDGTQAICNPKLLRKTIVSILERLLHDATRNSVITINETRKGDRLRYRFDIVSLLQHVAGDEYSAATRGEEAVVDSKAALMVIDSHTEWINKTSQWLEHWDAELQVECGENFQLAVELDLACAGSPNRASEPLVQNQGGGGDV